MLRSLKGLIGYTVHGKDADFGTLHDFLFDAQAWQICFLEVESGPQRSLIPAPTVGHADWISHGLQTTLGQDNLEPPASVDTQKFRLKNTHAMHHNPVQASDGEIGQVEDFIVDDEHWRIRYVVVNTNRWLPGRKVLVAPEWFDRIDWQNHKLFTVHTREEIKNSPPFDASAPVNRDYEGRLFDYYGRPRYWESATEHARPEFPCPKCGHKFFAKLEREEHVKICGTPAAQAKPTPKKGTDIVNKIGSLRHDWDGYRESNRSN